MCSLPAGGAEAPRRPGAPRRGAGAGVHRAGLKKNISQATKPPPTPTSQFVIFVPRSFLEK